jgi:hypothetical protein
VWTEIELSQEASHVRPVSVREGALLWLKITAKATKMCEVIRFSLLSDDHPVEFSKTGRRARGEWCGSERSARVSLTSDTPASLMSFVEVVSLD